MTAIWRRVTAGETVHSNGVIPTSDARRHPADRAPGQRGGQPGPRPGPGRADHRGGAARAAGAGRPVADRPRPGAAGPDGQHGRRDHQPGRPDRPDARSGRPRGGGTAGRGHQHHAGPDPAGVQRPVGVGAEGPPVRRGRLARAPHAADDHPRVRGTLPAGRPGPGPAAECHAPDRAGSGADVQPGRRAARAGPAGPQFLPGPDRYRYGRARPGRGRRRQGRRAGPADQRHRAAAADRGSRRAPHPAGAREPARQRARAHRARRPRSRSGWPEPGRAPCSR